MSFAIVTDRDEVNRIILLVSTKNRLIDEMRKKDCRAMVCRTGHECRCGEGEFFCVSVPVGQQDNPLYEYVHACLRPECNHVLSTADEEGFHEQCPLCEELDMQSIEAGLAELF